MAVKLVTTPARHWTCDVCGKVDTWTDEWRWFSSFRIKESCGCKVVARDLVADLSDLIEHHYQLAEEPS